MVGIEALSYYFPLYSIKAEEYFGTWGYFGGRGIREKTVAGYDEDGVTMALAAASGVSRDGELGYLATATFAGPRLSTTLATTMALKSSRKADFTGSTNASGEALLSCLDYVGATGKKALLVTSDLPRASPEEPLEHRLGAAATALLVSPNGGLQVRKTATSTQEEMGELFLDSEGGRRSLEVVDTAPDVVRESVGEVLGRSKKKLQVACFEPDGRFARRALGKLVETAQIGGNVVELSGDTGTSSAILALTEVLADRKEGEEVLLITYGGGSSVALSLRLDSPLGAPERPRSALSSSRKYLSYLRYAQFRRFLSRREPPSEISMGAYTSLPSYLEFIGERYRLIASRCEECDHLHFPPRYACLKCGGRTFRGEPLSGLGEVYAYTIIARGSSPTEFKEQQDLVGEYGVCLVQLEEGPRIVAQLTDCDPSEAGIGTPVESVLRRIYRQEGVVRYGYKFRPRPSA